MEKEKQFTVAENLTVMIEPNKEHEFLMTTAEVAKGFGISGGTIRKHKMEHAEELIEGKHFIVLINGKNTSVAFSNADGKPEGYQFKQTLWTKRASFAWASLSNRNVQSSSATGQKTW